MEKLREVVKELGWDPDKVHGYWFDCDETLIIDSKFDKNQFTKDLYMINTFIGQMKYTRNTFFKVSKPFRWYGPIHEFIVCDEKNISSGLAENIHVDVKMTGASWQGDKRQKFFQNASLRSKGTLAWPSYLHARQSGNSHVFGEQLEPALVSCQSPGDGSPEALYFLEVPEWR